MAMAIEKQAFSDGAAGAFAHQRPRTSSARLLNRMVRSRNRAPAPLFGTSGKKGDGDAEA